MLQREEPHLKSIRQTTQPFHSTKACDVQRLISHYLGVMPKFACLFLLPFLLPLRAAAQAPSTPTPEVNEVLTALYAYAKQYRDKLPALECHELVTSQYAHKGKVQKEVKMEGTLRETRATSGDEPFVEKYQFTTVDGKPAPQKWKIPYFVSLGFANAIGFSAPGDEVCYTYQLRIEPNGQKRLDLAARPNSTAPICHDHIESYRKTVILDPAGHLLHIERSMSEADARRLKDVPYGEMDYAPEQLGDQVLWLPTRLLAHDAKDEGRMIAIYSNFHIYTAKTTILPVMGLPATSEPPPR